MENEIPTLTFKGGAVVDKDLAYLFARCDDEPDEDFTRQCFFEPSKSEWGAWDDTKAVVESIVCIHDLDAYNMYWLTEEGQVGRTGEDEYLHYERIEGSGVHNETAQNWGYLNRLRYLHGSLYAIGNSGQVYQRLGKDQWAHMDEGMLQSPITADRDSREMVNLNDIGGSTSNDLYACGDYGHLFHWNGAQWTRLTLQDHISHLEEIAVVSATEIYICGYNGCLLKGNAKDGFTDISAVDVNVAFLSLRWFNGTLFLAAAEGLFTFDGNRIVSYETNLKPDLQGAHQLDSADGILWSFGYKDLAYFDGTTWTRVDHPDNPRIR
jgi:hypothetical protein